VEYVVERAAEKVEMPGDWNGEFWGKARVLRVGEFHAKSTGHRPVTEVKVLYDARGLYLHFRVRDRWVRAVQTEYQSLVCFDSCAEFFVTPREGKGYFNFEMNAIGTMLLYYITDASRAPEGFKAFEKVPVEVAGEMRVYPSLGVKPLEEIEKETEWSIQYFVPYTLFERFVGRVSPAGGDRWRANFFKCADKTSMPHWASWAAVGEELNFHQPDKFGEIVFAR
jgi:hypothetical protein